MTGSSPLTDDDGEKEVCRVGVMCEGMILSFGIPPQGTVAHW